jgi:hypothetical protein
MGWRSLPLAAIVAAAAVPLPVQPVTAQVGTCEVRGYGVDEDREGMPTNMRLSRNAPCWFDLRFGASGLQLTTAPEHGRVEVQGTRVTYTPAHQYVGEDRFVLQSRAPLSTTTGHRRPSIQFQVSVLVTR